MSPAELGRLVECVEMNVEYDSPTSESVLLPYTDVRSLLAAARELEALKEAMANRAIINLVEVNSLRCEAAAILAEKEKKRAE